ncbi:MAG: membrane protein insertion efficiency factor YidD [Ruminococcus sp.]
MKKILVKIIRFYQKYISANTKAHCKYYPTCSNYAIEAINEHGAFVGFFLALWRFLRCNPFSKGGYDPVPENKRKKER